MKDMTKGERQTHIPRHLDNLQKERDWLKLITRLEGSIGRHEYNQKYMQ